MSRNSKTARKKAIAKQFSQTRKSGGKGPARTKSIHTKAKAWYRTGKFRTKQTTPDTPTEE